MTVTTNPMLTTTYPGAAGRLVWGAVADGKAELGVAHRGSAKLALLKLPRSDGVPAIHQRPRILFSPVVAPAMPHMLKGMCASPAQQRRLRWKAPKARS